MTRGAVYYAVRQPKYLELAAQSARSLRRHMPDLPITLFTDLPECRHVKRGRFDSVERLPPVSERECHGLQVAIAGSPYDVSLFMGADTWACGDLSEVLDAIEHSPLDFMATTVQQYRYVHRLDPIFEKAGVPDAYPRYETGIVGMERNSRTELLMRRWGEWFEKVCEEWTMSPVCSDQVPLRIALHRSPTVRVGTLRDCYNYQLFGFFNRPVKVIQAKATEEQFRGWERAVNSVPKAPRYMRAGELVDVIDQ